MFIANFQLAPMLNFLIMEVFDIHCELVLYEEGHLDVSVKNSSACMLLMDIETLGCS